jgi:hypothetical protein
VFGAVLIASGVTKPDIVAFSHELEGGGYLVIVHDPAVGGVDQTMLKEDRPFLGGNVVVDNSEHAEDVTIWSGHRMSLETEAIVLHNLNECFVEIWIWSLRLIQEDIILIVLVNVIVGSIWTIRRVKRCISLVDGVLWLLQVCWGQVIIGVDRGTEDCCSG